MTPSRLRFYEFISDCDVYHISDGYGVGTVFLDFKNNLFFSVT